MTKPQLHYVYDPMCSWCWGYRPTWQMLQKQLESVVELKYQVGGLAPDSELPMANEMQHFLQQTWHKIARQLGTTFNFDFWTECQPRRSTYPACRAVIVARAHGLEQAMYLAIQQAYYLQAKNPSDVDTLIELAASVGIDAKQFEQQLYSHEVDQQLMAEIAAVKQMPIHGFPSLVLEVNGQFVAIPVDYHHWQNSHQAILGYLQVDI